MLQTTLRDLKRRKALDLYVAYLEDGFRFVENPEDLFDLNEFDPEDFRRRIFFSQFSKDLAYLSPWDFGFDPKHPTEKQYVLFGIMAREVAKKGSVEQIEEISDFLDRTPILRLYVSATVMRRYNNGLPENALIPKAGEFWV